MVYETVSGPPAFQIMVPRDPATSTDLRGRYFYVATDGLQAYEYTTDDQPDISQPQYGDFWSSFAHEVITLGVQHVFALGVRPYSSLHNSTEVELPLYQATVFIEDFDMPSNFETDWTNQAGDWIIENSLVGEARQTVPWGTHCYLVRAGHTN